MDNSTTVAAAIGFAIFAGLVLNAVWLDAIRRTALRDLRAFQAEIRRLAVRLDERDGYSRSTPPANLPISTLRLPFRVTGTRGRRPALTLAQGTGIFQ